MLFLLVRHSRFAFRPPDLTLRYVAKLCSKQWCLISFRFKQFDKPAQIIINHYGEHRTGFHGRVTVTHRKPRAAMLNLSEESEPGTGL